MTIPGRALTVVDKKLPARRRKAAPVICRVTVYDPRKLSALKTAQELGAQLAVKFDGYSLTITAETKEK